MFDEKTQTIDGVGLEVTDDYRPLDEVNDDALEEVEIDLPDALPIVATGWRILVRPVKIEKTSKGGIILAQETGKAQEYLRYTGEVISMGPLCYKHEKFAGAGPWCKVGDKIAFGRHTGQEVYVSDGDDVERYRLINDDEVMGVIIDMARIVTPF